MPARGGECLGSLDAPGKVVGVGLGRADGCEELMGNTEGRSKGGVEREGMEGSEGRRDWVGDLMRGSRTPNRVSAVFPHEHSYTILT